MVRKVESGEMDGWGQGGGGQYLSIKGGESIEFKCIDDYLYEVMEGEEDILGNTAQYNVMQTMVIDVSDGEEKVLTVQRGLGKLMKIHLEEDGKTLKDLNGAIFRATRYDKYSWDVKLIGHKKNTDTKSTKDDSKDSDEIIMDLITKALSIKTSPNRQDIIAYVVIQSQGTVKRKDIETKLTELLENGTLKDVDGVITL